MGSRTGRQKMEIRRRISVQVAWYGRENESVVAVAVRWARPQVSSVHWMYCHSGAGQWTANEWRYVAVSPCKSPGMGGRMKALWRLPCDAPNRRLLQFTGCLVQQAPGNDQQLNLLGALENVEDLGVTGPFFQKLGFAIAHGGRQFDTFQCNSGCGAAGLGLGHGGLDGIGLAVVRHPGRLEGQQAGGFQLSFQAMQFSHGRGLQIVGLAIGEWEVCFPQ